MKKRERLALILIMVLTIFVCTSVICCAAGETGDTAEERPEITIEVVEDIPAADIVEQELPLAAGPNTASADAARHAAMMGVVLLATIGYAVYFGRYDKKLAELRIEAAQAETSAMKRRKQETL